MRLLICSSRSRLLHTSSLLRPYPSLGRASPRAPGLLQTVGLAWSACRVHLYNHRATRVAGRAAREQTIAAATVDQLLDQLNDQAHARRSLRVAVDQRRAVVVEGVQRY